MFSIDHRKSFVSVIANILDYLAAVLDGLKEFSDKLRTRLTSESVNGISRVLQKLLTYFNCIIISTSSVPAQPVSSTG